MTEESNGWQQMNEYLISFLDDFNRVILSMRRGQEFTDYINASFIDVSWLLGNLRVDVVAPTTLTGCCLLRATDRRTTSSPLRALLRIPWTTSGGWCGNGNVIPSSC